MTKHESGPVLPEHMDRWSRNQRLYETLKGMGLFVSPIPEPGDPTKIREMIVSADLPLAHEPAEDATEAGIVPVVKRPVVTDVVDTTEGGRGNVVNFPTVR